MAGGTGAHSPSAWQTGSFLSPHVVRHCVVLKSTNRCGAGHVALVFTEASAALVAARQQVVPLLHRTPLDEAHPSSFSPPRQKVAGLQAAVLPVMQQLSVGPQEVPLPQATRSSLVGASPVVQRAPRRSGRRRPKTTYRTARRQKQRRRPPRNQLTRTRPSRRANQRARSK